MTPPPTFSSASGFAQGYIADGGPDEMLEADGSLRSHWRMFVSMLDDFGPAELRHRWAEARRLIHDNGITHNVYGDPDGLDRPWNLDFIPMLIPAREWEAVSAALVQRATLLDRLLADLYGAGRCVTEGVLPGELLFANPAFLRPCHGIDLPRDRRLHLYAADLVRTPGGQFQVLSDRSQAPSGAGYTLENRIVLSRVLPTVFRECYVKRLAPYFMALRKSLNALAPANRDNPRVVLLTPGPYNETYFEHAFLARYLGYTLVQGNDLTVRDARVYLKTLGGLQRVDVILRRVDDEFCDPLELFASSYLGVPGLLQAVREGNVAVANSLGSGLMQSPGFMPYLPRLCRFFLGEELKMPSVPTWWCGEASSRQYVLDNLAHLVIKPAHPTRGTGPTFGNELTHAERETLAEKIAAHPDKYVGQQPSMIATAPALADERAVPRRFVVRSYLAAAGSSYTVMTGGLVRITRGADSNIVSMQKGGGAKDLWVLSDSPVREVSLLNRPGGLPLSRGGGDLPSRIADDLFWLGRYVQRAEGTVRIARGVMARLIDQSNIDASRTVRLLARGLVGDALEKTTAPLDRELVLRLFDQQRSGHLRPTLASVHRLARLLRDRISVDAWRILQALEQRVADFKYDAGEPSLGVGELLDNVIEGVAAFVGLTTDSMSRGQAWRFLDMGHRVERGLSIARLLRDTLVQVPDEQALLESVLDIADSSLTYRRRYLTQMEVPAIIDLLLADETNPRSVAFQLATLDGHLAALPRESTHPHDQVDRQHLIRLRTIIQVADLHVICRPDGSGRPTLHKLLQEILDQLTAVSTAIGTLYFTHATSSRAVIGLASEGEE